MNSVKQEEEEVEDNDSDRHYLNTDEGGSLEVRSKEVNMFGYKPHDKEAKNFFKRMNELHNLRTKLTEEKFKEDKARLKEVFDEFKKKFLSNKLSRVYTAQVDRRQKQTKTTKSIRYHAPTKKKELTKEEKVKNYLESLFEMKQEDEKSLFYKTAQTFYFNQRFLLKHLQQHYRTKLIFKRIKELW